MSTGKATGAIDAAAAVALLAMALPACALLAEAIPVSAALEAFRAAALLATERRARFRDDRRALATELRVLSFAGFLVALSPSAASMLFFGLSSCFVVASCPLAAPLDSPAVFLGT